MSLGSDIVGILYTFTVVHRAFDKAFADDIPYIVGMCDIAQAPGARVIANIVGISPDDVRIGMPLRMFWEARATLPRFRSGVRCRPWLFDPGIDGTNLG